MSGSVFWPAFAFIVLTLLGGCGKQAPRQEQSDLARDSTNILASPFRKDAELLIIAPDGSARASFEVEIAATREATTRGLMWRESMAKNQGMLFDPHGLSNTSFWMKNTYLPLDIIFIDAERRILNIAENTRPFSEELIEPADVYRYVLEINAGSAREHNISIGDTITWQETP